MLKSLGLKGPGHGLKVWFGLDYITGLSNADIKESSGAKQPTWQ